MTRCLGCGSGPLLVCVEDFLLTCAAADVCAGPCPWRLLFWFNSAPHGWTQSDGCEPVEGDAQWSRRLSAAAALQKGRQAGSWTAITCKEASHRRRNPRKSSFPAVNKSVCSTSGSLEHFRWDGNDTFHTQFWDFLLFFYFTCWMLKGFLQGWSVLESRLHVKQILSDLFTSSTVKPIWNKTIQMCI